MIAGMDGATRLVDGSADTQGQFEYGRLEIFARGFWSNVCNNDRFTPDSAQVACKALGYDGGAALRFTQSYAESLSPVRDCRVSSVLFCGIDAMDVATLLGVSVNLSSERFGFC